MMMDQNENRIQNSEQPVQNPYNAQYAQQAAPQNHYQQESQTAPGAANYVNYYADPDGREPKKGGAGAVFLKIVAGLAALAIVSVSSIELYKIFGKNGSGLTSMTETSSQKETEDKTPAPTDENKADASSMASWVAMASPEDALSIPDIVDKALPSVVGISAVFEYTPSYSWGFYSYDGQTQQGTGTGTGIVLNEDGYIITNAHCIYDTGETDAGKAVSVSVFMGDADKTEYEAQIVGYDLETDLAVLKVNPDTPLVPAEFGDSDTLRVGELVVAIGNPLGFELFGTTTCGIVSALNREVTINEKKMTLIQTDTSINSGNSGGPLLNSYGQVIGINSAKISSSYSAGASVEGLGFAIPITDAREIIDDLINYGYVTGRPQLGVMGVDVSEMDAERYNMPQGVYVHAVTEGSAAELAGIRQGDVITKIQDQRILTMDELNEIKNEYDAGDTVVLEVFRQGEALNIELVLKEVTQQNS